MKKLIFLSTLLLAVLFTNCSNETPINQSAPTDYNKIGERVSDEIAELGKIVMEASSKGLTTSSRDGFNIICTGSTPADDLGYEGSTHTVWQDRYGTYYFTVKNSTGVHTVRMFEQDLNSAYSAC